MSIISCPECGNSVSTDAKNCPHCGLSSPGTKQLSFEEIVATTLDEKAIKAVVSKSFKDILKEFNTETLGHKHGSLSLTRIDDSSFKIEVKLTSVAPNTNQKLKAFGISFALVALAILLIGSTAGTIVAVISFAVQLARSSQEGPEVDEIRQALEKIKQELKATAAGSQNNATI